MSTLFIDVMSQQGQHYYSTVAYRYNPRQPINWGDVERYVHQKLPMLKHRTDIQLIPQE